ncbi:MAG: hypothetical protein DRO87_08770 [Candidatus Thorarchaeota archaeon]|nr:MAG: hypothetical protein DRO87_08770 [Candidatus Thorarchaeota archaeon]RLI55666.1 MAG: hypothetical protein DRP09_09010 [Candidatus Thorarchaeota archaeon]
MHAKKAKGVTFWVLILLVLPFVLMPGASAWEAGDEAEVFGHTFAEEYWTNDSLYVSGTDGNGSLTASFVHVGEFEAFLIAFNEFNMTDGTQMIAPYQLFGMHYITPGNQEVFIGAVFAFLLVHNETFGSNNLPDVGNEPSWYVVPLASDNTWPEYTPAVEPIPATKLAENHYRFGMHYYNLTCRIVDANNPLGFWISLATPILQVVISELTIQYDIRIEDTGEVHAESLYTIGQVEKAKLWGVETDPQDIIGDSMEISAVHFLSVFASQYSVVGTTDGNEIEPPTSTTLMNDNVSIQVGARNERAFDIGFGRQYSLVNETTDTVVDDDLTAINTLLGVRLSDLILVLWQAPLSAWIFARMAYGLSSQLRNTYNTVGDMVTNVNTAFTNTHWWYAVTFPTWNGLRVQQDPVYVAYTNMALEGGGSNLLILGALLVGLLAVIIIVKRR